MRRGCIHGGVTERLFLLGYNVTSLGNQFVTSIRKTVPSKGREMITHWRDFVSQKSP